MRGHSGLPFCTGASPAGERIEVMGNVMANLLWKFLADDKGAAAIEYGLLAAGIAVAIIATVAALGTNLNTTFSTVSNSAK